MPDLLDDYVHFRRRIIATGLASREVPHLAELYRSEAGKEEFVGIEYLSPEDWTWLYKKYPSLMGDISSLSWKNELAYLKGEVVQSYLTPERRKWVEDRIRQLEGFA